MTRPPQPTLATTTIARSMEAAPLSAVLRPLEAKSRPQALRLAQGSCIVGSGSAADLVIDDTNVSRKHAEITLSAEGVRVKDLGSRNGTFYLSSRIDEAVLPLGAQVVLGTVRIAIEPDASELERPPSYAETSYQGAIGVSTSMRELFARLVRLEGSLATVLIEGESGVGKEVIAKAVHDGSKLSGGPFVAVNCGALPRELVASELFGHKKGAFTGAVDTHRGAFERADGGTLFLDEIGELPLDVQPYFLRALESGEITPLGSRSKKVSVRLLAATNRSLEDDARAGRFREDLYYRLAVVRLRVPSLRERVDDIEPLARWFAAQSGLGDLPGHVVERLRARSWAGNARELRNAVAAYAALGELPTTRAQADMLDLALRALVTAGGPYNAIKEKLTDTFTKLYLEDLMRRAQGNQSAAARLADMDRTHLIKLLQKHGITGW